MIGSSLAHYRITAKLGEGGMGVVYRAHDGVLDRDVAIKILPTDAGTEAERLRRFDQEAKLLASLNHENIATVHGLEVDEGRQFIVMELMEGEDLAARIKRGPLPMEESLAVAVQVARALAAAHDQQVVHRDLKPANVMLLPGGKAKVLDFGLAKTWRPLAGDADPTQSATITAMLTGPNARLGTPAYMSPEQLRGETIDKRTDIWSFGCALYECLTGRRPFAGDTMTDCAARILERDPDLGQLPSHTPIAVRNLIRRCLAKDRNHRLRDAGDIALELEEAIVARAWLAEKETIGTGTGRRRILGRIGVTALILLAALAVADSVRLRQGGRTPGDAPPSVGGRFTIELHPEGPLKTTAPNGSAIALSPDGRHLVYTGGRPGRDQRLYWRPVDRDEVRPLPGTAGVTDTPLFSPDSREVAFLAGGYLQRVSLDGGSPARIVRVERPYLMGGSWGADGTIIYAPEPGPLMRVPAAGDASPQQLTSLDEDRGETAHGHPVHLPGGDAVLMTAYAGDQNALEVLSLTTGRREVLVENTHNARYLGNDARGYLLYGRSGELHAHEFDVGRLELVGREFAVIDDLGMDWAGNCGQFGISERGMLVYAPGPRGYEEPSERLGWIDRDGTVEVLPGESGSYARPTITAEGRRAIVQFDKQLTIVDLIRGSRLPLAIRGLPWAIDGSSLYFGGLVDGRPCIQRTDLTKATETVVLHKVDEDQGLDGGGIADDGRQLVFTLLEHGVSATSLWGLALDGLSPPLSFRDAAHRPTGPTCSPDGKWIAYVSTESGRREVYVLPLRGSGRPVPLSTEGGYWPKWSPEGDEIFYCSGDRMMAVSVTTTPDFTVGETRVLFTGFPYTGGQHYRANYDYDATSRRFLCVFPSQDRKRAEGATRLTVVSDIFTEIERRTP